MFDFMDKNLKYFLGLFCVLGIGCVRNCPVTALANNIARPLLQEEEMLSLLTATKPLALLKAIANKLSRAFDNSKVQRQRLCLARNVWCKSIIWHKGQAQSYRQQSSRCTIENNRHISKANMNLWCPLLFSFRGDKNISMSFFVP